MDSMVSSIKLEKQAGGRWEQQSNALKKAKNNKKHKPRKDCDAASAVNV